MGTIEVRIDGEAVVMAKLASFKSQARANVRDAVVEMQYRLQDTIRGLLSGQVLHVRSGALRNSITVQPVKESGDSISGPVTANTIYAPIQEYGGTIHPTHARYLTIPLAAALTGVGVARFSARELISDPSIGGFTGTFFAKGILFGKVGTDITPVFALKSSVTLPARPYMSRGLNEVNAEVQTRLTKALQEAAAT